MKKCLFLIPTSFNDGTEIPGKIIDRILSQLFEHFGGYSQDGVTEGTWRMDDGSMAKDKSLKIWVILQDEKEQCLKGLIKKWAKVLKQETILYESMDWTGEFIRPD